MPSVGSVVLPLASLALVACASPKFEAVNGSTPDAPPAPPTETITCEDPGQTFCTPGGCDKICHRTDLPRRATFGHCDKTVAVDGVRTDTCEDRNVCLEPAPNTSQGSFCLALCGKDTDCPGGVACGERPLSDGTSVRVCDPGYQDCEGSCCDPTDTTGNACTLNRPCYLVSVPSSTRVTNWTVCEYASGGALKGTPCTLSRDCIEGLTCVGAESGVKGSGTCLVVCDPSKPNACPDGPCQPFPKQWGYCL
jgi:hypothetical protein